MLLVGTPGRAMLTARRPSRLAPTRGYERYDGGVVTRNPCPARALSYPPVVYGGVRKVCAATGYTVRPGQGHPVGALDAPNGERLPATRSVQSRQEQPLTVLLLPRIRAAHGRSGRRSLASTHAFGRVAPPAAARQAS